jgi:hypothetical protein
VLIPLIGARNLPQLQENLRATRVKLEPEHLSRLDAMSEIELGFPHDFLGPGGTASQFIYGETLDRLDAHRGEIGS